MSPTQTIAPIELILNRTFQAPIESVFRAWTDAAVLDRWFSPFDDCTTTSSVDLRVGGAYRIEIRKPDGSVFTSTGNYVEIDEPHRLAFTWMGACDIEPQETLVTIEFFSVDNTTQVTLTHQHFSNENARQRHEHGWMGCFEQLAKYL